MNTPKRETGQNAGEYSAVARAYMSMVLVLGFVTFTTALGDLNPLNTPQFLVYLAIAALASIFKVPLPGITGTISVNFLFVLMAVANLSLGETVILTAAGAAVQYAWYSKEKLRLIQLAFNVSSIATAAFVAWHVHRLPWLQEIGLERLPLLCLSASAYFVLNTVPVAIVIAFTERKPVSAIWNECYIWSFPYYVAGGAIVGVFDYLGDRLGWQTTVMSVPFVYLIYRAYQFYLGRLEAEKNHAEELAALHLRTIEALALAIEAKDDTTNEHLHRVQVYALELGKDFGLTESELNALQAASLLHDIGKLAVPEHIISKPGRLTPEEFEKMKIHPVVGAEILERVQFPYPVVPIVASHHEKWDGTGYPNGLSGEQIPIGARILAAVDCLDALASDRQYRRALPLDEAMAIVREQSGKGFDPRVVDTLSRRYRELEALARNSSTEKVKLSKDIRIAAGAAPAAGFQETSREEAVKSSESDFLASIADARTEVQRVFELLQSVGSTLTLSDTLAVLAQRLQSILPSSGLAVWRIRDNSVLHPEYVSGQDAELFRRLSIPVGQGLAGWVAETGKHIINGNPSVEPGYTNDEKSFSTLRSAIAVPLEGINGRIGVLSLYHRDAHAFTQDHLRILLSISLKLGLLIENRLRSRPADTGSTTDQLTGLPNSRALFVQLEREIGKRATDHHAMTVLVCSIDDFSHVSESFGQMESNRILARVASVFKAHCRESDYVARLGIDEFAIVLYGTDLRNAEGTIERVRDSVTAALGEYRHSICHLSIGAAEWRLGMRAEELLGEADRRMYKAKRDRKRGQDHGTVITLPAGKPRAISA